MRGLLCIEPLYHKIVAGEKTQTRRSGGLEAVNYKVELAWNTKTQTYTKEILVNISDQWEKAAPVMYPPSGNFCSQYFIKKGTGLIAYVNAKDECKPRYKIGEVLYLKEPYRTVDPPVYIEYAFDNNSRAGIKYENKLFMPEAFARAFIKITGIRCERLMDISEADCQAEGVEQWVMNYDTEGVELPPEKYTFHWRMFYSNRTPYRTAYDAFIALYRFANKVKEVDNIWVWVYEFEYLNNYKP